MAIETMTKEFYNKEGRLIKREVSKPPKYNPTREQIADHCQYLQSQLEYWQAKLAKTKE
jgi:hypothetical protein